jgi:glycosyltransferase involved in cell wall biosynthesis
MLTNMRLGTDQPTVASIGDRLCESPKWSPIRFRADLPVKDTTRVFYFVETLNVGGTETQLVQTALRLHSRHNVTVGCLCAEGPLLQTLQRAGIAVVEFRKGKTLLSARGLYQLLRLAIFLRKRRFHVVHAYDLMANLLGVPAAWLARVPIIISSRRYHADLEWYRPWRQKVIRMVYSLSTYVLVNSKCVRDLLVEKDGLPLEKIRVLYNGVDLGRAAGAPREAKGVLAGLGSRSKRIAVVANMHSPTKGHASLVVAAKSVCREFPDVVFILIGDGRERPKLERQVHEAGLENNFLFLGHRSDIPHLLACCDFSVLPSETEALPNAVLEAMAAGLPVVATCVGGIPELIEDGENGLLVPPQNSQALAAAISRLLRDRLLAARLAHSGQERMRTRYGFDRLIGELGQLYAPRSADLKGGVFERRRVSHESSL